MLKQWKSDFARIIYITSCLLLILLWGCQESGMKHEGASASRPLSAEETSAMHRCTVDCTRMCQDNQKQIQMAQEALTQARQSLQRGDNTTAQMEIDKALQEIQSSRKSMEMMMKNMPSANVCCPLSGKTIDTMNVPPEKTRMHKGVKIGFSKDADMTQWDKLSDAEKEKKIKSVIPPGMGANLFEYTR